MRKAFYLPPTEYIELRLQEFLKEDIGRGDMTTQNLVGSNIQAQASIIAEASGILAGMSFIPTLFATISPNIEFEIYHRNGEMVNEKAVAAKLSGPARGILMGERTALNLLQKLSGIATYTNHFVQETSQFNVRICDTRKTTPGFRLFEKHAVSAGGGSSHRFGLDDGILIKDNHIIVAGSITSAVKTLRDSVPHTLKIEVECDTLKQVEEALLVNADVILLDNMSLDNLKSAVMLIEKRAVVEASGGVTLANVRAIAETGVDIISIGALTHSAPILPLKLECTV